ncbi:MAG: restriction endonuclease subunit S domain-containing protein [Dehalococcoidia bacterium]
MNLSPYARYEDSGLALVGSIPEHWSVRRQRYVASLLVSNVDKKTAEGEIPVRLCNYLDVYNNERITGRITFMRASASSADVDRFRLRVGDVLITKDSEAWDDIGVPSLVEYTAPDLVCGYHLAILRPNLAVIRGAYLMRVLQCHRVAVQFHVAANGVTRYGLSQNAIKNVRVLVPPLIEQDAIVRFLDYVDWHIGRLVGAKQRLVGRPRKGLDLLREYRTRLIADVVTGKLDVRGVELPPPAGDELDEAEDGAAEDLLEAEEGEAEA